MTYVQDSIRAVIETARVEDVVSDFVRLKKNGTRYKGLCPFHQEKTPSFVVTPSMNIYKCFGCGEAGDAVTFLRKHEKFSFVEAIEWLAQKYGITLERREYTPEEQQRRQKEESLYVVNDFARAHFKRQLTDTDEGRRVALAYFNERGFTDDIIEKFGLGYASALQEGLKSAAVSKGFKGEMLKKLGLVSKNTGHDFFRNRVMFPIRSISGKVIAFAGRALSTDSKTPKYINSPETEIYVKSRTVYGIYLAKRAIRKADECLLVEGYTDVITLHQNGIENVVASSGTALTKEQLLLIKRNSENLKIIYDGDAAGIKAALRGLDLALELGLNVKIVLLPQGEDPDSMIRRVGASAFREYITGQADDFIFFKIKLLEKEADTPIKKTAMVKDIIQSVSRIPNPLKRGFYLSECARLLKVRESLLVSELNKVLRDRSSRSAPSYEAPTLTAVKREVPQSVLQERSVVSLLLSLGEKTFDDDRSIAEFVIAELGETFSSFTDGDCRRIAEASGTLVRAGKSVSFRTLSTDLSLRPVLARFLDCCNQPVEEISSDSASGAALVVVNRFKISRLRALLEENQEKLNGRFDEAAQKALIVQQKIVAAIQQCTEQLRAYSTV